MVATSVKGGSSAFQQTQERRAGKVNDPPLVHESGRKGGTRQEKNEMGKRREIAGRKLSMMVTSNGLCRAC